MRIRDKIVLQGAAKAIKEATDGELGFLLKEANTYDPDIADMAFRELEKRKKTELGKQTTHQSIVSNSQVTKKTNVVNLLSLNQKLSIVFVFCIIVYGVSCLFQPKKTAKLQPSEAVSVSTPTWPTPRPTIPPFKSLYRCEIGSWVITKEEPFGFKDLDDFDVVNSLLAFGDKEAMLKAIKVLLLSERATFFEKGTEILIHDRQIRMGVPIYLVRKRGDLGLFWVHEVAIFGE